MCMPALYEVEFFMPVDLYFIFIGSHGLNG